MIYGNLRLAAAGRLLGQRNKNLVSAMYDLDKAGRSEYAEAIAPGMEAARASIDETQEGEPIAVRRGEVPEAVYQQLAGELGKPRRGESGIVEAEIGGKKYRMDRHQRAIDLGYMPVRGRGRFVNFLARLGQEVGGVRELNEAQRVRRAAGELARRKAESYIQSNAAAVLQKGAQGEMTGLQRGVKNVADLAMDVARARELERHNKAMEGFRERDVTRKETDVEKPYDVARAKMTDATRAFLEQHGYLPGRGEPKPEKPPLTYNQALNADRKLVTETAELEEGIKTLSEHKGLWADFWKSPASITIDGYKYDVAYEDIPGKLRELQGRLEKAKQRRATFEDYLETGRWPDRPASRKTLTDLGIGPQDTEGGQVNVDSEGYYEDDYDDQDEDDEYGDIPAESAVPEHEDYLYDEKTRVFRRHLRTLEEEGYDPFDEQTQGLAYARAQAELMGAAGGQ